MKNIYFISGLPRTGSTLLSSILDQNPEIHAGGNSPVCQIMWDMQVSCQINAREQLLANNKISFQDDFIRQIPHFYYKNVLEKNIVDKCRSWTLPDNVAMIKRYIKKDPKIIVLTRPIEEIVRSFVKLRKDNGWSGDLESDLLVEGTEPIMRSLNGVNWAKQNNNGEFLFIEYEEIVDYTQDVINKIYDFYEIKKFNHNFNYIENKNPENDLIYGMIGMHDVRSTISKRKKY